MKIVQQVMEGKVVYRSDKILSARELNEIFECYGEIKNQNSIRKFTINRISINLLVKNISYLGNPHPLNKKRIQIPEVWKNYLNQVNTLLCGVYSGPKEIFIVVFTNKEFITKSLNQSSAHVKIEEIMQASIDSDFKSPDETGTFKIIFLKERFANYINEFVKNIKSFNSVDDIYNWQKTYNTNKTTAPEKPSSNSTFEQNQNPIVISKIRKANHSDFLVFLANNISVRLTNRLQTIRECISPIYGINYQKILRIRGLGSSSIREISKITNNYQRLYNTSIIEDEILLQFRLYLLKNWKTSDIPKTTAILGHIKVHGGLLPLFINPYTSINKEKIDKIENLWTEFCKINISFDCGENEYSNTKNPSVHNSTDLSNEIDLYHEFITFLQKELSVRSLNRFEEILKNIDSESGIDYSRISNIRNLGKKSINELNKLTERFQKLNNATIVKPILIEGFREFIRSSNKHILTIHINDICQNIKENGGLNLMVKPFLSMDKQSIEIIKSTWFNFISGKNIYPSFYKENLINQNQAQTDFINLFKRINWNVLFRDFIDTNRDLKYEHIHSIINNTLGEIIEYWEIDFNQNYYLGNQDILKYLFVRFWRNQNEFNYNLFRVINNLNLNNLTKERRRQIFSKNSKHNVAELEFIVLELDSIDPINIELKENRNYNFLKIENFIIITSRDFDLENFEIPTAINMNAVKRFAEANNATISQGNRFIPKNSRRIKKENIKKIIEDFIILNEETGINSSHISEELKLYGFNYPSIQIPSLINRLGLNVRLRWDWTWVIKDGNLDIDPIEWHSYSDFFRSTILNNKLSLDQAISILRNYYPKYRVKNAISLISQHKDKTLYRVISEEMILGNWYKDENMRKKIYNQLKYPKSCINKTVLWPSFIQEKYGIPSLILHTNNYHWKFQVENDIDLFDLKDYIYQITWNAFILIDLNNQTQNIHGEIIDLM
jgi:hypothetical protein